MNLPCAPAIALMEKALQIRRASAVTESTSPAQSRYGALAQTEPVPEAIRGILRPNSRQTKVTVEDEQVVIPHAVGLFRSVFNVQAHDVIIDGTTEYQVIVPPEDSTDLGGYVKAFLTAVARSN